MPNIITDIRQRLEPLYGKEEASALTRIICCEMLGQAPTDYFLGKDIALSANQKTFLQNIISRLGEFEPIQYIQQQVPYLGRTFFVDPGVLIPRPETAELTERVIRKASPQSTILDIGTGSGCIAISLSLELPQSRVYACDISEEALTIAQTNNKRLKGKVEFFQADILSYQPKDEDYNRYDVIVSNPPYVTQAEASMMEPNVLRYEPHTALFVPNDDPLLFYRQIAELAKVMLKPGGLLAFEINRTFGAETKQLLEEKGYQKIEVEQDISKNDRFVFGKITINR